MENIDALDIESENKQDNSDANNEKAQTEENGSDNTENTGKKVKEPFNLKKEIWSWIKIFIIAIVIAFLVNNVIIMNANVPTGSMQNTIMAKDHMIGLRTAYWFKEPKRGEIVIFINPDYEDNPSLGKYYVKRVIGEPGDKVVIKDAKIYINDSKEPLKEDYLPEEWVNKAGTDEELVYEVPQDCYFLMGDNRNSSNDARFWKNTYVNKSDIIAKAEFVYWPWPHKGFLKHAEY